MQHYPIFTNLNNRSVLLVGAGEVAQRKAESLLQSGANILLVAENLNVQFQSWIKQHKITLLNCKFEASFIDDVFLVIAATNDEVLNEIIFKEAELRGKFCNTVDNLPFCSFIVPSIVDRHPIKIAISSAGTAPVLARSIRQKIEIMIPKHIGKMSELAGKWRNNVKFNIKKMSIRRLFWERLFSSRFESLVANSKFDEAEAEIEAQLAGCENRRGEVVLVGAGPGNSGLLTIHALQAIQAADVVLYDALVSEEIKALIRKDADKICVGKRAGLHQVQQHETNQLLIKHALMGKRVVRLKGGDPFVFGRGGEEALELQQAGVLFRIVPGVTAALGATAYAGIPLTHREFAQTAVFITGHCQINGESINWRGLARGHQTIVIYMGTIKAEEISSQLICYGCSATMPVAIISNGTMENQRVDVGILSNLPILAKAAQRPALIVIGEVVTLRNQMKWFGETV